MKKTAVASFGRNDDVFKENLCQFVVILVRLLMLDGLVGVLFMFGRDQ